MESLIFWFLASIFNGAMDMNFNMFDRSVFSKLKGTFWNPDESWRNKWKNGDRAQGERFWGSSTIFVSITDSWHLFKAFMLLCLLASILTFRVFYIVDIWWINAIVLSLIYSLTWLIGFESTLKVLKK